MKKILSLILIMTLIMPTILFARQEKCLTKINVVTEDKILRVCNDVSDIICKDVKLEERRSCVESNEYIISKDTTRQDLYNFAKGCFKSGVSSAWQFVTDFIPELVKSMWEVTKTVTTPTGWRKLKGYYESAVSVGADIYEAVLENPSAIFSKIWDKIVDVVGPMMANFDCLKPQKKVEGICGFVAGWVVPPYVLAKILVRGVKEIKFLKNHGTLSVTEKGKLAKALEHAEKREVFNLKQYMELSGHYKRLGYTEDEIELLYKTGGLGKFKLSDLKSLSTPEGKLQKIQLLGEKKFIQPPPAPRTPQAAPLVGPKPSKIEGVNVSEGNLDDFHKVTQEHDAIIAKMKQEEAAKANALNLAEQKRIKEQGVVEHEGMTFEEISIDDPRFKEAFGNNAKPIEAKKIDNMIEYTPTESPGVIQRNNYSGKSGTAPPAKESKVLKGPFNTNYVQVMEKNSMGVTAYMPAEIVKKTVEGGMAKYTVRMFDKSSNSYKERSVSLHELKNTMRAKESKIVEKEIQNATRDTGFNEGFIP